jgi:hypothetical protein
MSTNHPPQVLSRHLKIEIGDTVVARRKQYYDGKFSYDDIIGIVMSINDGSTVLKSAPLHETFIDTDSVSIIEIWYSHVNWLRLATKEETVRLAIRLAISKLLGGT